MPVNLKVQKGTRSDETDLCLTCVHSIIIKGGAQGEEIRHCSETPSNSPPIPFRVVECTDYHRKGQTTLYEMREIAWVLRTDSKRKVIGFSSPEEFRKLNEPIIPQNV